MHQKCLNGDFISQKASCFWGLRPKDPLSSFIYLSNIQYFLHIQYLLLILFMNVNKYTRPRTMLLFISNFCFRYAPKLIVSSFIFQKLLRRGTVARPFPIFLWLSRPNCLSLRGFDSTLDWRTWFPLLNKFLDPPVLVRISFGKFLDLLLIILINYTKFVYLNNYLYTILNEWNLVNKKWS